MLSTLESSCDEPLLETFASSFMNVVSLFFSFFDISSSSTCIATTDGRNFNFSVQNLTFLKVFALINLWLAEVKLEMKKMGKSKFKLHMSQNILVV